MGCKPKMDVAMQTVKAGNAFSIDIPKNLSPTENLHDFAALQYADDKAGYYLIGLVENKAEMAEMHLHYSLSDYAWFVERKVSESLDTSDVQRMGRMLNAGLESETTEFFATKATPDGPIDVWFRISVVESPTHFYQLIAWTSRGQDQEFHDAFEQMECSFAELDANGEQISQPGGAESSIGS